jgi:hypothetical protein
MRTPPARGAALTRRAHTLRAPRAAVLACSGQDIYRRSAHRKAKYLFAFPGRLAPLAAGGKLGQLSALDTPNPVLHIELPQVRGGRGRGA